MLPLKDNLQVRDFPILTALLVAMNVLVFFMWEGGTRVDIDKVILYGTIPYEVTHPGQQCVPTSLQAFECKPTEQLEKRYNVKFPPTWKTLFASMFMHLGLGHLIGNMLFLIVFGISLEAGLGRRSFALFYLAGGLAAMLAHTLFDPSSPVPALGASGAISAVMGGYVMVYPKAKFFTWIIPPLPFVWGWIRAAWLVGILMGLQALEAYFVMASAYGGSGGGVAYFAHFGGFAAGAALVMTVLDRTSIENLRRKARLASGDERAVREHLELAAERISSTSAAAAQQAYGQAPANGQAPAYAQVPAYGQPAAGYAQAPAYAQPPAYAPTPGYAHPPGHVQPPAYAQPAVVQPVPPPTAHQTAAPSAFMPDPFAPSPAAQPPAPQPPVQRPPQAVQPDPFAAPRPPMPPPAPGAAPPPAPARPRPAPGSVERPPGC